MKKNIGKTDKAIRLILAAIIVVLLFTNVASGTLAIILFILAVIFVVTSLISFCPLYALFGISTFKQKK
jgi:hypothetical protein